MAVFKCKMCGGSLNVQENMTVIECDYCGTKQTIPNTDDEVLQNLYNRANNLRLKSEFDKAAELYEKIVEQDDTQAEAHWGIVLCKYGIEYVKETATGKRVPTCHRTLYEAVTQCIDYQAAIKHADTHQKYIYEAEAKAIDDIQRNILKIVNEEEPFDVFICYKETDASGNRTIDSTFANDIYYQLTQQGYKVFYAAITLEDKLGHEYEPYIFAALNSAKVMLVLGTKLEYFNGVWVKNEWSRFLNLMKSDRTKMLIPCYRDMDAYELPEEFAHLQAQDMGKIGFINDLVRGINKVIDKNVSETAVVREIAGNQGSDTAKLIKRMFIFLEDQDWQNADGYAEKVLDADPENGLAYLGKLMVEFKARKPESLKDCTQMFDKSKYYERLMHYADDKTKATLQEYLNVVRKRIIEDHYNDSLQLMRKAKNREEFLNAAVMFEKLTGINYKQSQELAKACRQKADDIQKDEYYDVANAVLNKAIAAKNNGQPLDVAECDKARAVFESIKGWRDADVKHRFFTELLAQYRAEQLKKAEEDQKKQEQARKSRKVRVAFAIVFECIVLTAVIFQTCFNTFEGMPMPVYLILHALIVLQAWLGAIIFRYSRNGWLRYMSGFAACFFAVKSFIATLFMYSILTNLIIMALTGVISLTVVSFIAGIDYKH